MYDSLNINEYYVLNEFNSNRAYYSGCDIWPKLSLNISLDNIIEEFRSGDAYSYYLTNLDNC